jgi:hypothetical protein
MEREICLRVIETAAEFLSASFIQFCAFPSKQFVRSDV